MAQAIDYEFWKFVLSMANFLGLIVVGAYTVLTRQSDQNSKLISQIQNDHREAFETLWTRHDHLKDRLIKLESRPGYDEEISEIHRRLNAITRELSLLTGSFTQTSEAVKRMHDYLITKGS